MTRRVGRTPMTGHNQHRAGNFWGCIRYSQITFLLKAWFTDQQWDSHTTGLLLKMRIPNAPRLKTIEELLEICFESIHQIVLFASLFPSLLHSQIRHWKSCNDDRVLEVDCGSLDHPLNDRHPELWREKSKFTVDPPFQSHPRVWW